MSDNSHFEVRIEDGITILDLLDDRVSDLSPPDFGACLFKIIATRPERLIINFSKVRFAGSGTIGILVEAAKKLSQHGGMLKFCCMDENVRETFRLLGLEGRIFEIFNQEQEAIAAFD